MTTRVDVRLRLGARSGLRRRPGDCSPRPLVTRSNRVLGTPPRSLHPRGGGCLLFGQIPDTLAALNPTRSVLAVYVWLDIKAGNRGWSYHSQREIAAGAGVSRRSVSRALALLREHGLIVTRPLRDSADILIYEVPQHQGRRHPTPPVAQPYANAGVPSSIRPYKDLQDQRERPNEGGVISNPAEWFRAHGARL